MTERDAAAHKNGAEHPSTALRYRCVRLRMLAFSQAGQRGIADLGAWLMLALAALIILWPLGLTNRILAGVDAFTYFAPYWDYRMAALRGGQIPLWNPYLFLGVPFLANPQAAVLYPLHWPLSWLTPEQALVWSALLHAWLASGFTYMLARRSFSLSQPGAWLAGLIFGLGGFTLARIENINQLNALAWLPAVLWLYDAAAAARHGRIAFRWGSALAIIIALCLLAGHTQSFFVNMVGLGLYAVLQTLKAGKNRDSSLPLAAQNDTLTRLLPLLAVIPAMLLAAAQLLPTLELNGLGLRTGGLPYRQAVSFSLRPRLLAQIFLPPFGGGLGEAFGSEGYAEFVGYVGIVAIVLAGIAIGRGSPFSGIALPLRARRRPAQGDTLPIGAPLGLVILGIFLALGAYNPVYYLLWRFVPGFDLFRAPARWLALFALGAAVLAGSGLDALKDAPQFVRSRYKTSHALKGLLAAAVMVAIALVAIQQPPPLITLVGWVSTGLIVVILLASSHRWPRIARSGLIALTLVELWLGSRGLPFTQATAPLAAGLRNAPAALLAATADQPPAGRDRFLSLSDIRYDPGDLAELRALQADRLPSEAVERLVRAAKQVEVIAPNLPLRFRLPAVDGYDGGVLPLGRYVKLQSLFLPAERLIPDGRLREQLAEVPDGRLLDLTGVRFIITDKQRDLWVDDIYYDLEQAASLSPSQSLALDLTAYPAFSATAIGLIAEQTIPSAGSAAIAELEVTTDQDSSIRLALLPGPELTSDPPAPMILQFPRAATPRALVIRNTGQESLVVRSLSLIDARTDAHTSITISPRGDFRRIYTGDVKIYERRGAPGRAWLVHGILPVDDDAAALAALADPAFDARSTVIVTEALATRALAAQPAAQAGPSEAVTIVTCDAEQLTLRVRAATSAVLVVADSFYPGWEATVDGQPAAILRANLLLRGVTLTPGEHKVVFRYRPASWRHGMVLSLATLVLLSVGTLITVFLPRQRGV